MASDTSKTLALVACGVATVSVLTILLVGAYRIFRLNDAKREAQTSAALTPNRTRTVPRRSTPANPVVATPPADSFEVYRVDVEESERILTEQEDGRQETTKADRGSYFAETREGRTAQGISPERRWCVFRSNPISDFGFIRPPISVYSDQ